MVVVTSRDRLTGLSATHGARRLALDVLPPGEAVGLLAGVLGGEWVAAEPDAARELAEACGFLPLALRIAAANLACHPDWSVAGYLERLRGGDRLAELAVDGDPQAAVAVAFDGSYASLDADARRLFRLLGLVPGPEVSAPAAAALAGEAVPRAARLLERLAAAHLVEPRGSGRYGLHDLLRAYARQRAERDDSDAERQAAPRRLLGWYVQATDAADRLLYPEKLRLPLPAPDPALPAPGFSEQEEALAWLGTERVNLVAAVEHAAALGPRPAAWLLADALRGYFWQSRHMVAWQAVASAGLAAAEAEGDPRAQAALRRSLGMAQYCLGAYPQAGEHYRRALALARQAGWREFEAVSLSDLGDLSADMGRPQQAADELTQALALHRQTGYTAGQAQVLEGLSDVYRKMGRPAQAVEHLVQALALCRQIGSNEGQTAALRNLGEAYRDLGQLERARECLGRAQALARQIDSRYGQAYVLHALAAVERDAGRYQQALALVEAALALTLENRHAVLEVYARNTLGSILLGLGRLGQAAEQHRRVLALACQADNRYPQAEALLGLAAADRAQGQPAEAVEHARQALALTRAPQGGYRILQGQAQTALAAAQIELGDAEQAIAHARQALEIQRQTGHRLGEARALVVLGHALYRTGDAAAARPYWQEALALLTDIGHPDADQP